jgi:hypothetical protein
LRMSNGASFFWSWLNSLRALLTRSEFVMRHSNIPLLQLRHPPLSHAHMFYAICGSKIYSNALLSKTPVIPAKAGTQT